MKKAEAARPRRLLGKYPVNTPKLRETGLPEIQDDSLHVDVRIPRREV